MNQAAIVLAGGRSRRMGRDKALLPFGGEPMLVRVVRRLHAAVELVVIATADEHQLPDFAGLSTPPQVVRDPLPHLGPLAGLAAGLAAVPPEVEAVFVCGADYPLLRPEFVQRMFALLEPEDDIAVPRLADRRHPLAAVYRPRILPQVLARLAAEEYRLMGLLEACHTRTIESEAWRDIDPENHSLINCNTPGEYARALALAGF